MSNKMGLIIMNNFSEFGSKASNHLKKKIKEKDDFIIPIEQVRFSNGEGKIIIKETIREKHVFILSDIGNYGCTYKMLSYENHMSPDDHFQDLKRIISAMGGNAAKITLMIPLLYSSRQHKRKGRESLDCAIALQELERLGVNTIVTFDCHDPNVQNAIPLLSFENFYPTHIMLEKFIDTEDVDFKKLLVISPDAGALDRARYYADMLQSDVGIFNKRRDLSTIVDGKNPIVAHEYLGKDVEGRDAIIVDDMIASGESILDVVKELKNRKARKIYAFATFALFTKGIDHFEEAFKNGDIEKVYITNLSYVPEEIANKEWLERVDCSPFVANIISTLYNQDSLSPLLNGKEKIIAKIQAKINEKQ